MVFNVTFNNISDTLYHIVVSSTLHISWAECELKTLVVIGTDCIGSYKSNYHMIMTTMACVK